MDPMHSYGIHTRKRTNDNGKFMKIPSMNEHVYLIFFFPASHVSFQGCSCSSFSSFTCLNLDKFPAPSAEGAMNLVNGCGCPHFSFKTVINQKHKTRIIITTIVCKCIQIPAPSKGCQMVPKGCQFTIP